MAAYSLYLHIPFCAHRCAYCDFNTYDGLDAWIDPYMHAITREVEYFAGRLEASVGTVFLGGGTPSRVPVRSLRMLMDAIRSSFTLEPDAEITLEANPGGLSLDYLEGLREAGFNRISMGMQSAHPDDLRVLERQHDFFDVVEAVRLARRAGFDNLNLDLIFGLPHQPLKRWKATLEAAIDLGPEHLSVYSLILEHGTPMEAWVQRGLLQSPDPDLAADMYERAIQRLAGAGFRQYEISNWALEKDGGLRSCRHNLQYWRNQPYLGLGAGAHGFAGGYRTSCVRSPQAYIKRLEGGGDRPFPLSPATVNATRVDREAEMKETMMMGLRLVGEGVVGERFASRFGMQLSEAFPDTIEALIGQGLVEWVGASLRLTEIGVRFGNRVFREFL